MLPMDTTLPKEIPADSQFYCLIGMPDSSLNNHSFIHVGYLDRFGRAHPLVEVGKLIDAGEQKPKVDCSLLANIVSNRAQGRVLSENRSLRTDFDHQHDFQLNYSGYEITREQYLHFLGLLKIINKDLLDRARKLADKAYAAMPIYEEETEFERVVKQEILRQQYADRYVIKAFVPVGEGNWYEYLPVSSYDGHYSQMAKGNEDLSKLRKRAGAFALDNTCRHTSIDLLDYLLRGDKQSYQNNVSSFFKIGMPCHTRTYMGGYSSNLHLLPLPPTAYDIKDPRVFGILQKLYRRQEQILQEHAEYVVTPAKFEIVKKLYTNIVKDIKPANDVLQAIILFNQNSVNAAYINAHRGFKMPFFEHKTNTRQMMDEFEVQYRELNPVVW